MSWVADGHFPDGHFPEGHFPDAVSPAPVYPSVHARRSITLPRGGVWLVDPDEPDYCEIIWADVLPDDVTLVSVAYTLPDALAQVNAAVDSVEGRSAVLLSGPTHGSMHHVLAVATLSNAQTMSFTAPLRGFNDA